MKPFSATSRTWLRRLGEIILAAVLLLMLSQLQEVLLRSIGRQLWFRPDGPVIYAVGTRCGPQFVAMEGISRENGDAIKVCGSSVSVRVIGRDVEELHIFLNGTYLRSQRAERAAFELSDIPLREGNNLIELHIDLDFQYPLASRQYPPDLRPRGDEGVYRTSEGMFGRDRNASNRVWLRWEGDGLSPPKVISTRMISVKDGIEMIVQGEPGATFQLDSALPARLRRLGTDHPGFLGQDGYSVERVWLSAVEESRVADIRKELTDEGLERQLPLSRKLQLSFSDQRKLIVDASACLPSGHALLQWAQRRQMSGPEFVLRMFNVTVFTGRQVTASALQWSRVRDMEVRTLPEGDGRCTVLGTHFEVPEGTAYSYDVALRTGRDVFVIDGPATALRIGGRQPDSFSATRREWAGVERDPMGRSRSSEELEINLRPAEWDQQHIPATPVAPEKHVVPEADTSPFGSWKQLVSTLPGALQLSTTTVLPIAIILIAIWKFERSEQYGAIVRRRRAALVGLLAFVSVFALEPLVQGAARLVLSITPVQALLETHEGSAPENLRGPLAIIAVFSIYPFLMWMETKRSRGKIERFPWLRTLAAAVTVASLLIGTGLIFAQRFAPVPVSLVGWPNADVYSKATVAFLNANPGWFGSGITFFFLWLLVCIVLLPFSVYWLMRAVIPEVKLARTAVACSALIFLLPALGWLSDYLFMNFLPRYTAEWAESANHFALSTLSAFAETPLASPIITFLAVVALMVAFRDVLVAMLPGDFSARVDSVTKLWMLAAFALFILATVTYSGGTIELAPAAETSYLLGHFQSYAPLLALIAAVSLVLEYDRTQVIAGNNRFDTGLLGDALICAIFAGFIASLWERGLMSAILVAGLGWIGIRYWVLDPNRAMPSDLRSAELAEKLLTFSERTRLLDQRLDTVEKNYTSATSDTTQYEAARSEIEALRNQASAELGSTPQETKRAMLALGPGATPLANARTGAIAGLIAAVCIHLLARIDLTSGDDSGRLARMLSILQTAQGYSLPFTPPPNSPVLMFLHSLLQAVGPFALAGGLFGYAFHRIRGSDGFTKSLVFISACAIAFLLSFALRGGSAPVRGQALLVMAPFSLFLMILGSLVFDGGTLRSLKIGYQKLVDVYGFRTTLGYASVAGGVAGLQIVLSVLDVLFPGPAK